MSYRPLIYWLPQIVLAVAMAALGVVGGWLVMTGEPADSSRGAMMIAVGLVFVGLLVWLTYRMVTTLRRQQARYDWAAAQRRAVDGADETVVREIAERARRGELSDGEIEALQANRPEVPYPG